MWYGANVKRSYKYMIFASKMPSLRIDQSDLKCKNGCDYFGNPQWQGYCSKCYREQLQRQRRAEKASSGTLPKPEPKKTDRGLKLSSHSSFSKFEEKRLRQSETLKKAHLLKFSVFKKSSSDEQDHAPERKPPEFKVPGVVNEGMKREFRVRFPNLPQQVDRDARVFVHAFITDTIRCSDVMSVDELSERVQRQYQRFMKYMDTSSLFTNVDAETKEQLIDFVEKHAMMYLHEQPGVLFSPSGTEDERADRAMSERIQQLGWVSEDHLECRADRASAASRRLLYKAISELLGMDSSPHPGGKLWRVQRACRHVLALCGALASADDLLPALIFTVLKANPPRLVSNINFVTRFCNAQRLMTGEGGYYFTNLCCAVSFIENLSAESLSMDKKEFDSYMAMPASIGGSTWAAALSLCGATREAEEQRGEVDRLLVEVGELRAQADQLATDADTFEKRAIRAIYNMGPRESLRNKFKEINILTLSGQYIYENLRKEIVKKVQDVFTKTPLEIKPRRDLPRLGKLDNSTSLIDLETPTSQPPPPPQTIPEIKFSESKQTEPIKIQTDKHHLDQKHVKLQTPEKLTPPKSPQNQAWERKHSSSLELLTPSPVGFMSFDSRSIDELMTPDEFGSDHLAPGLSNINYDIDLSDLSGDNSLAEDTPREKDPFSPDGIKKPIFDPFAQSGQVSTVLDKFDELILVDQKSSQVSEAFEVVHRVRDPFDPIGPNEQSSSFSAIQKEQSSLLDDSGSPTAVCLLPSPLQPQSSKQN